MPEATQKSEAQESGARRFRRRIDEARAKKDAELAAQKAQRLKDAQSQSSTPSPSTALERPNLESATQSTITTMPAIIHRPPSSSGLPFSPTVSQTSFVARSLDLSALSPTARHREPIAGLSPSTRAAPSPSIIHERLPQHHSLLSSCLGIDPAEMPDDVPALADLSGAQVHPVDESESIRHEPSPKSSPLHVRNLGAMEFVIPLAMSPRAQKQYIDTYRYYWKRIKQFLQQRDITKQLVQDMTVMCDRVAMATTHMDLEGGGPNSQDEVYPEEEASYAESCSEKFVFLGKLLHSVRYDDIHLAIVARPGQLMDFIETFLKAKKMHYARPDTMTYSDADQAEGSASVTIVASASRSAVMPQAANLIVAFDETYSSVDFQVKALRNKITRAGPLAPVIHLIVFASLEHINLCIPTTLHPINRLRTLIFCMLHSEKSVGRLAPGDLARTVYDPAGCASQVAQNIRTFRPAAESLPSMPSLNDVPIAESDLSNTPSELSEDPLDSLERDKSLRCWPDLNLAEYELGTKKDAHTGEKRTRSLEFGETVDDQAKRLKTASTSRKSLQFGPLHETAQVFGNDDRHSVSYTDQLEAELMGKDTVIKDMNHVLDAMQFIYETNRTTMSSLSDARKLLEARLASSAQELEVANAALKMRNEEVLQLKARLHTPEKLSEPSGAAADASPACDQANVFVREADISYRDKALQNLNSDFLFTRQQYQAASIANSALRTELQDSQAVVTNLERRVGAHERLTTASASRAENVTVVLNQEIIRLKAQLRISERRGRDMEEKIDKLERGRGLGVQTRGSSQQPHGGRSPRGSRGVSPAAGVFRHENAPGIGALGTLSMGRTSSGLGRAFERS